MSMLTDEYETDDFDGDAEDLFDDYDSEDARSEARRRRRRAASLHRVRQERLRRLRAQRRGTPAGSTGPRTTTAAIQTLGLETKVDTESLRRAVADQARRANSASYGTAASVAVNQFFDTFPNTVTNPYLRAGLRFAPLMLIAPHKRGSGIQSYLRDPRVLGGVAVGGLVVLGQNRNRLGGLSQVTIIAPQSVALGTTPPPTLRALVPDAQGNLVDAKATWNSYADEYATINQSTGQVTLKAKGPAIFTATVDGRVETVHMMVTAAAGGGSTP